MNKTIYVNGYLNELIEKCKNASEHYCIYGLNMLMWPYANEYVMGNCECYELGQKHIIYVIMGQTNKYNCTKVFDYLDKFDGDNLFEIEFISLSMKELIDKRSILLWWGGTSY